VTVRAQWMVVLGIVAALALGLTVMVRTLDDELFPVGIGSDAPDFEAVTLEAEPRTKTLDDYRGEVVLLNIWATWCLPCREEMPSLQRLHEALGDDGLRIVAVSIDRAADAEKIRAFAREYGLTFEILHDPSGEIQRAYQTTGVPETFILGREGDIRRKQIGAVNWFSEGNRTLFAALLDVPIPPAPAPALPAADSVALRGRGE
jgi:cytochrome c biogenesis protein CcmG, thiol:disulfide interchange protein DsbE